MLLSFTLKNFRSFKEGQQLNLMRATRDSVPDFDEPDVLPAVAVFGPNASGKSNLLRGVETMFRMIRTSATRPDEPLPYTPFLLDDTDEDPTEFLATMRFDGVRYDYGFSYNRDEILTEWLYSFPRGRQRIIYERDARDEEVWRFGDSLAGPNQTLARATRANALLISTAAIINHDTLTLIYTQFSTLVTNIAAEGLVRLLQLTLEDLRDDPERSRVVEKVLRRADLGVEELLIDERPIDDEFRVTSRRLFEALSPEGLPPELEEELNRAALRASLVHRGAKGKLVKLPFPSESVGTRNLLALLGPILEQLASGGVLLVDELDTSLHPRLVAELVRLFQSPITNLRQAQLLLSTHDVTAMMNTGSYSVLGRDQIWFINKDEGSSHLTPLMEFSPRIHEVYSRNYLNGRYGALPSIDDTAFWDIWDMDPR